MYQPKPKFKMDGYSMLKMSRLEQQFNLPGSVAQST